MDKHISFCLIFGSLFTEVASSNCMKDDTDSWKCNYIPTDIPAGISKVKLVEFYSKTGITPINSSYFQSKNWEQIKHLELLDKTSHDGKLFLMSRCFSGLKMLVKLKIHIISYIYQFDPNVFLGLNNVKTLDLSGCERLMLKLIIPTLNGPEKLPGLENLLLSKLGLIRYPIVADDSFTRALKSKNITHLDVSLSQIALIDVTSAARDLTHLKVVNLSHSIIAETFHRGNIESDLLHIDMVDMSHAVVPRKWFITGYIGKIVLFNYTVVNIDPRGHFKNIFAVRNINVSALVSEMNSVWVEKCRVDINEPASWHTKGIVARYNNIKRLDVTIKCDKYKLKNFEHVDIAHNGLEFIHPSVLECLPNLSKLDLSYNQLFKMMEDDVGSFENLFQPLAQLGSISLSSNNLDSIPKRFFEKNLELENIDLSGNRLRHVAFKISHLKILRLFNLQNNHIQILNDDSINILNSIHPDTYQRDSRNLLFLTGNPISCSKCQTKHSIQWLTMTTLLNVNSQSLTCVNEAGERVNIDGESVKLIQRICDSKTIILSSSIVAGVLVSIMCVTAFVLYKRRKYVRRMEKKRTVLQKVFEGQGRFEFVTFLSFCSDDEDFVDRFVYNQLNDDLKIMTGTDRNLVCVGDEYLRPGFLVLDETVKCIERASVMIAVVSNAYCDSSFCHNELDQANRLNKPIILMLKEHVDENLMMPTMKMLFKSNVRILWDFENGEYVLKTTWKNVCASILDLITDNL